jgi:hypothetical protein
MVFRILYLLDPLPDDLQPSYALRIFGDARCLRIVSMLEFLLFLCGLANF